METKKNNNTYTDNGGRVYQLRIDFRKSYLTK